MKLVLSRFKKEIQDELKNNILNFWLNYTIDNENDGFYGSISNNLQIDKKSDKGSVLNSRILWTFSKAYLMFSEEKYLKVAKRAYDYIIKYFWDYEYGGVFWSVDYKGNVSNSRKQVYALAFAIYGFAEYFKATNDEAALNKAVELFRLIEKYAYDNQNKGYIEALGRNFEVIEDLRLSPVDMNEKKSMNTHLHVLEAYTNLLTVWRNEELLRKQIELIEVFEDKIIDKDSSQFKLFFDEYWKPKGNKISFGHDIEGSWLLYEASEKVKDKEIECRISKLSLEMAKKVLNTGYDLQNGGIFDEKTINGEFEKEKSWWPQAEAVVGFFNAYMLSKEYQYLIAALDTWEFIKEWIIDYKNGEWFWSVDEKGKPNNSRLKVEAWKCPYHNSRMCFEIIRRVDEII